MKRILQILIVLAAVDPAESASLQTLRELNGLRGSTNTDLAADFVLTGTVFCVVATNSFVLVDDTGGALLRFSHGRIPAVDEMVEVTGTERYFDDPQHSPRISRVTSVGRGRLPDPLDAPIGDIADGHFDYRFVRTQGTVVHIARDEISENGIQLVLHDGGRTITAATIQENPSSEWIDRLRNSRISVTGLCDPRLGYRRLFHRRGINARFDTIEILEPALDDGTVPSVCDIGLADYERIVSIYKRHSVEGRVLASWHNDRFLVETTNGWRSQILLADGNSPPPVGAYVRDVGFPETDLYTINLASASWQDRPQPPASAFADAEPRPVAAQELFVSRDNGVQFNAEHHGRLVRLRGRTLNVPRADIGDLRLHLDCDGTVISVDVSTIVGSLSDVAIGCEIEATGICLLDTENWRPSIPFPHAKGIYLVTRRPSDIRILACPPWWTPVRLAVVIGSLLAALLAILVWNRILQHLVERRGRQLFREQIARTASELKTEERTRLAVELHDAMSQNISSATLQINAAERLADTDRAKERHHLQIAAKTLQSCREELRNCIWDLRNQSLDEPDLSKAITRMLHVLVEEVSISVRFNVPRARLSDNTVHAILKTIRELVVNAVRHGKAKSVRIAGALDGGRIVFSVTDDGVGFDPDSCPGIADGHFGLQGIRERVRQLQGTLEIKSAPNAGTRVVVTLSAPVPQTEDKEIS